MWVLGLVSYHEISNSLNFPVDRNICSITLHLAFRHGPGPLVCLLLPAFPYPLSAMKCNPLFHLCALLLALSGSGRSRSAVCWQWLNKGIQVGSGSIFGFQLLQRDAVFLQQLDQHLGLVQELGVLLRKMLHDLFNIMIGAHGRAELLISLEFRFSSEHILAYHYHREEHELQKLLRYPGSQQKGERIEPS